MSEIIIKVQLDLSDAVKAFMASLMSGASSPAEAKTPVKICSTSPEPAPTPTAPAPVPESAPAPVAPKTEEVSREKIRNLVKSALIAEKASAAEEGGVKAILRKFGAANVTEVKEEDFVEIAAELTQYKDHLPAF